MGKKRPTGGKDSSHKEALADFWNAVQDGNIDAVKRLLPSIDAKRDRDYLDRAMINAVYGNNLKLLDLLLSAGADPDPAKDRHTLLMSASIRGKLEIVKRLIKAGADYDRQTKEGTALSEALCYNKLSVVKYLEK